jgi:hypothetical protein
LRKLLVIVSEGVDIDRATWFYYDKDWSCDGDASHTFFVVYDGKVVDESCHFSSEEPLILKREQHLEPIWQSHPYFDEAFERHWYRRFYTETMTGQLMVLRPDEPILYHYERPQVSDVERQLEFVTLVKMYRLLGIAIPLLMALAFPSIKEYMAIASAVLGIEFLWCCWATRKVGKSQ